MTNNRMIKVYGFPRSGNNLLSMLLYKNFYEGQVDCSQERNVYQMGHWSRYDEPKLYVLDGKVVESDTFIVPYGKLFAGHAKNLHFERDTGIYVFRDFNGVAKSVYRWKQARRRDQEQLSFEEYLKTPLDWVYGFGIKAKPRMTLREMWDRHIAHYLTKEPFVVSYADLIESESCELTMRRVAGFFGLEPIVSRIITDVAPTGDNARMEGEE
jgi:hypothetical protein